MTERRWFSRAKSVREYGFNGSSLIEQPGTVSGFLLPWDAIDDDADAVVNRRPAMYLVTGEFVTDGIRHPLLAVSDAYMKWAGFQRDGREWKRSA